MATHSHLVVNDALKTVPAAPMPAVAGRGRTWIAFVIAESNDSEPSEETAQDRPFMKGREPNSDALAVRPA